MLQAPDLNLHPQLVLFLSVTPSHWPRRTPDQQDETRYRDPARRPQRGCPAVSAYQGRAEAARGSRAARLTGGRERSRGRPYFRIADYLGV